MAEPQGSHEEAPAEPSENPEEASAEAGGPPQEREVSCKYCGKKFPGLGALGKHMWTPESEDGHHEIMLKLQKEGKAEKAKKDAERKAKELGPPPTPERIYKGEPDATGILREILDTHPDIGESAKDEVISWAQYQPLNPQTVAYLLSMLKGVNTQTANIVAQKYALALQKSQAEAKPGVQVPVAPQFIYPQQGTPQIQPGGYLPQQYPSQFQQQQPAQSAAHPYHQPQPRGITKEDVEDILRRDREVKDKESLISVVKAGQEQTRKLFEKIEKGELSQKPAVAPPTKEEIAKMAGEAANEAAAKVVKAKAQEDREERRHSELLTAVKSGAGTQQVSGYHEDSYRLLAQGLSSVAGAMERKEPIKIILEHVPEILYGAGAPPGPKDVVPGATGDEIAGKIKKEWVLPE